MIYFQSLTREEFEELLLPLSKDSRQARYRAKQIYQWVYQRHVTDWAAMTDLSKLVRAWLAENVEIYRLPVKVDRQSKDGTHKFLWSLADDKTVESVIIPAALREKSYAEAHGGGGEQFAGPAIAANQEIELDLDDWKRLTACISSQVGCTMGCKFCLTGIQGLDRHLGVHEIVTQVLELRMRAPITNIVFMGMGEPLHNLDNVAKACRILIDEFGMNFSKRKVTVSTSGLVPAIEELGRRVDVSLAISLNATTDEQRSEIMPVNRKWNISALLEAVRNYPLSSHRRVTFEYVMLRDFNDSLEDAERLLRLTRGIPSKINLIPFNEHSGSVYTRPTDETVKAFQHYLVSRGMTATVRISRGRDILAACGQLRSAFGTARGTDRHRDWKEDGPSAV